MRGAVATLGAALTLVAAGGCGDGDGPPGVPGTATPPPDRGEGVTDNCPPTRRVDGEDVEIPPEDDLDRNADSSGAKDWFLGRVKYVVGDRDLIVTFWCINDNRPGAFGDYRSVQIETSVRGVNTTRVRAGPTRNCPYANGKNVTTFGPFEGGLLRRLATISVDPRRVREDSFKVIYEMKRDQTIAVGRIVKGLDGMLSLDGEFRVGPNAYKPADALTPAERDAVARDFKQERDRAAQVYPDLRADPPAGDCAITNEGAPPGLTR